MAETTSTTTKNSPSKTQNRVIFCLLYFMLCIITLSAIFLLSKPDSTIQETSQTPTNQLNSLNPIIKSACSSTFYPSLCLSTVSFSHFTTLDRFLEASINHTIGLVSSSQPEIVDFFIREMLNSQEKTAFNDCLDMLDQTLYELGQAMDNLRSSFGVFRPYYGDLKTLLSAAMPNENTCIDGFSDLEGIESKFHQKKGLRIYLEMKLKPIVQMISNILAIVKHMEESIKQEKDDQLLLDNYKQYYSSSVQRSKTGFLPWMSKRERRMMGRRNYRIKPNVVVANDGSGNYTTIGEAVKMAPNMSMSRYVIKIKAGIYKENLEVPRNKMNVMFFGSGLNSTVISGNRSIVDGYSTFTSATLTVIGDRFLARDLTVENTASPEMYQAVAIRVTSNSAFFRCNFTSNQDTLYAHSLRQFYRECIIQGTIDFIFGNAAAIFHNCQILARKPIYGQSNMITAQSREDPNQNTGFSLSNCTISAAPDFPLPDRRRSYTFLGRPWRNYSRTVIMRSYLGDLIHPQGWSQWDQYSNLDTVEYIEYINTGPGADTRYRVKWRGYKKNCTEDLAKRFTIGAFLHGPDDWLHTTGFPLFHDP
ncbi:pectinesterase-like [Chenopodium quinoa]|uniref:pectinesterase-like n=1 Tax=Chenopodium quinoa TaxID=63459 RepID=UPI000B77CA83|nr:pectinesterase-like [Chenopodium quinoa]